MNNPIPYIDRPNLSREIRNYLIDNNYPNLYWSDDWSPDFYREQARLGFIATAYQDQDRSILLPELQYSYAVLFWNNLRLDRGVKKLFQNPGSGSGSSTYQLVVNNDIPKVLEHLSVVHTNKSWLIPSYKNLLCQLTHNFSRSKTQDFNLWAVTLETPEGSAAGELGYTIGKTYTSLTGFHYRHNEHWNHFGKLQMVLLARHLENRGVEFWNMGHPHFIYKKNLGALEITRDHFILMWDRAGEKKPVDLFLDAKFVGTSPE